MAHPVLSDVIALADEVGLTFDPFGRCTAVPLARAAQQYLREGSHFDLSHWPRAAVPHAPFELAMPHLRVGIGLIIFYPLRPRLARR